MKSQTSNYLLFVKKQNINMHFYSLININKITDLNIDFGLNYAFQGIYNEENARIGKSLLLVIQPR